MKVAQWAEIRRLDPFKPRIDALVARYPQLSAVRVHEEIARGDHGYRGGVTLVRDYLRRTRPRPPRRVYQEVPYEPGQALQIDWGSCGRVRIGRTWRNVSVFVAVLCYSRMMYIEFCLSQRKAEFYRSLAHALEYFGGSPRQVIFDNLKAAVLNGHGRSACLHPEFLALCGHFYLEPIACQRRDPESKGGVEASVRYVKRNCLAGRDDELTSWEDYGRLAAHWRDEVANVRLHATTQQRPVDRLAAERARLRPLPSVPFDTDELVSVVVSSHARVRFDGNRYSVPPQFVGQTLLLQARRRRELPSPVPLRPKRPELLEETAFDEPDPAFYDRFCAGGGETPETTAAPDTAAATEPGNPPAPNGDSPPFTTTDAVPAAAPPPVFPPESDHD